MTETCCLWADAEAESERRVLTSTPMFSMGSHSNATILAAARNAGGEVDVAARREAHSGPERVGGHGERARRRRPGRDRGEHMDYLAGKSAEVFPTVNCSWA